MVCVGQHLTQMMLQMENLSRLKFFGLYWKILVGDSQLYTRDEKKQVRNMHTRITELNFSYDVTNVIYA